MELILNNELLNFENGAKLSDVLKETELFDKKGIAVAVNSTVIPKNEWSNFELNNQDKIMVITATAGG
ncbi:MAG: sulfur carrier protein ThiS [Putridiphycobacter sp.]